MLIKTELTSFNVWAIDQEKLTMTMFNHWDGWKQKYVDHLTAEQMTDLLNDIATKKVYKIVTVEQCNAQIPQHSPMRTV